MGHGQGEVAFTKRDAIAVLGKIATTAPESTKGNLRDQIRACKLMYRLGYEPALKRLGELSEIDAARTKVIEAARNRRRSC